MTGGGPAPEKKCGALHLAKDDTVLSCCLTEGHDGLHEDRMALRDEHGAYVQRMLWEQDPEHPV